MLNIVASLILATFVPAQKGNPTPPNPNPAYQSDPWSPAPVAVSASLAGPSGAGSAGSGTVNIGPGSSQSLIFSLDLTYGDMDTFQEYRPSGVTYPAYGTKHLLTWSHGVNNGREIPGVGLGPQALEHVNDTIETDTPSEVKININYRAIYLHDTPYPMERVLSYKVWDTAPATQIHNIKDTNQPVVSKNITITRQ